MTFVETDLTPTGHPIASTSASAAVQVVALDALTFLVVWETDYSTTSPYTSATVNLNSCLGTLGPTGVTFGTVFTVSMSLAQTVQHDVRGFDSTPCQTQQPFYALASPDGTLLAVVHTLQSIYGFVFQSNTIIYTINPDGSLTSPVTPTLPSTFAGHNEISNGGWTQEFWFDLVWLDNSTLVGAVGTVTDITVTFSGYVYTAAFGVRSMTTAGAVSASTALSASPYWYDFFSTWSPVSAISLGGGLVAIVMHDVGMTGTPLTPSTNVATVTGTGTSITVAEIVDTTGLVFYAVSPVFNAGQPRRSSSPNRVGGDGTVLIVEVPSGALQAGVVGNAATVITSVSSHPTITFGTASVPMDSVGSSGAVYIDSAAHHIVTVTCVSGVWVTSLFDYLIGGFPSFVAGWEVLGMPVASVVPSDPGDWVLYGPLPAGGGGYNGDFFIVQTPLPLTSGWSVGWVRIG